MAYTYILLCGDGTYYTGATLDWERRLKEHQQGKAARYTRARLPVQIIYLEEWPTLSEAMKRESEIKKLKRPQKEEIIASSIKAAPRFLHKES